LDLEELCRVALSAIQPMSTMSKSPRLDCA